ncbi:MAG: hypothetical protein D6718_05555 [Acidobacteria bacterium]|nr:MAG: hypothetical protein D6718_05555 [Acidobacteriota bacterium]
MSYLNQVLRALFDGLLLPFRSMPPVIGLVVVSLLSAILALIVFKKTSNQDRIAEVKRQIHACLFEIRLFNDDLRAIFRAQGELLRHNLHYLGLSLVPMAFMLVPFALAYFHLEQHYGYRPLRPGEAVLVRALVGEPIETRPEVALEAPEGITVLAGPAWFPAAREIDWKIRPEVEGRFALALKAGDRVLTKTLRVGGGVQRVSPRRPSPRFADELLNPGEDPLPGTGPVAAIEVAYPQRQWRFLGAEMPWWVGWLALMLLFALALRNRMGVSI